LPVRERDEAGEILFWCRPKDEQAAYWHLFDDWNKRLDYRDAVKPFGFLLVAYADPLSSTQEVGRLIHHYERDPARWLDTEWMDLYEPAKRFRIGVRSPDHVSDEPGNVYVKT
jgi:hypothetical protein